MLLDDGHDGRWTLGVVVLVPVISFQVGGMTTIVGSILAAVFSVFAGESHFVFLHVASVWITQQFTHPPTASSRSNTKQVQIPYLRTSHRIDFLLFFLGLWMDILALLTACSILARTLSSCLDTMTGGLLRMWILGEEITEFIKKMKC